MYDKSKLIQWEENDWVLTLTKKIPLGEFYKIYLHMLFTVLTIL